MNFEPISSKTDHSARCGRVLVAFAALTMAAVVCAPLLPAEVTGVPDALREHLHLSPFYSKYADAMGIPVLASAHTSDVALAEVQYLVDRMLEHRPEIARAIAGANVRVALMGHDEYTTDIPEHSDLTPAAYWNQRARGLGASRSRPAVSCGEENLLCLRGDPYAAENIFVHEFAHVIHEFGMAGVDSTFDDRLNAAYDAALAEGLWKGAYAATNRSEYWAEAAQSWFDTNRENDREHNHVNTREELKDYDPRVAALCEEVFGDGDWRYQRPDDRKPPAPHFADFDRNTAPVFEWPRELMSYRERFSKGDESLAPKTAQELIAKNADDPEVAASSDGGPATSLFVRNLSREATDVSWVDGQGTPHRYATLRPSDHFEQSTYGGHVWRVTSESGRILNFVALPDDCIITVADEPAGTPAADSRKSD